MERKNHPFSAIPKLTLICVVLLHAHALKSSQAKVITQPQKQEQQQPLTIEEFVFQQDNKPIDPQTINSLAATIIEQSETTNTSKINSDNDDDESSNATVIQINPRKGRSTPPQHITHNYGTVFALMVEENYSMNICPFPTTDFDSLAPKEQELLELPQRITTIEAPDSDLEFSQSMRYIVDLAKNKKTLIVYKFNDLITGSYFSYAVFQAPKGKRLVAYDFFLDDRYLLTTYNDGSSQIRRLINSQKTVTQKSVAHPSSGKLITYSDAFKPNNIPLLKDKEATWSIMSEKQEDEMFREKFSEEEQFGIVFATTGSKAIKIALPRVGIVNQINGADIKNYSILPGDPIVLCCDTTDGDCHVAIVQSDTFIPVISGVNYVIRGPQDYILVQTMKNQGSWFLIKLGSITPTHTSSTSPTASASNTPVLSATPSPSTSQSNLATITNSNSNSPSTQPTESSTPTEPFVYGSSGSTSSVSVCTAPPTSPTTYQYPTCIGELSSDDSSGFWYI